MVMRNYPTYRIEDFYTKSFREGGITYPQFLFLHKAADDYAYNQNVFLAAIHGIDMEETSTKIKAAPQTTTTKTTTKHTPDNGVLFGDPEQYSHLSDQERTDLTQKMLKHWGPMVNKMNQQPS